MVIFYADADPTTIVNNPQHDLDLIHRWSIQNKLTISTAKSKAMFVGRQYKINKLNHINANFNITLCGLNIKWVTSFRSPPGGGSDKSME